MGPDGRTTAGRQKEDTPHLRCIYVVFGPPVPVGVYRYRHKDETTFSIASTTVYSIHHWGPEYRKHIKKQETPRQFHAGFGALAMVRYSAEAILSYS